MFNALGKKGGNKSRHGVDTAVRMDTGLSKALTSKSSLISVLLAVSARTYR